jgi:hypothetical protein
VRRPAPMARKGLAPLAPAPVPAQQQPQAKARARQALLARPPIQLRASATLASLPQRERFRPRHRRHPRHRRSTAQRSQNWQYA